MGISLKSPFVIYKQIFGYIAEPKLIRKIKEGLLVETVSIAQASRLENITNLGSTPVKVSPHAKLNQCKGVVTCRDLLNCSEEEIVEGMSSQGVIDVRRIKTRRNGILENTASLIITFNKPTLPQKVKAGFHSLPVRLYIPDPIRCYKCQNFGHTTVRCVKERVCVCGKPLHEGSPCQEPISCINCNGNHSSRSRNCPTYKQEKAIQEVKVRENLTYPEAKKKVIGITPEPGVSYAKVVSTTPKQITDIYKELANQFLPLVKEIVQQELNAIKSTVILSPQVPREQANIDLVGTTVDPLRDDCTAENTTLATIHTPSPMEGVESSKKRALPVSPTDSITSEVIDAEFVNPITRRQKKGWPKGKPRKSSVSPSSPK
ncbi:hypothetical protein RN001_006764 [Aquatica leii]|uniref:Gag-like protein n=1 Tax=Aquatica leii TaxID=1421715 RepID=A0AAN7Q932_9COLE|nr:hypothetical protein RN001_006764 [Aquatica leii]